MVASRDAGDVFVVRDGYVLYWPDPQNTLRGAAGYAVRSDDPFIGEQLNKLHVAPEGTVPVPPSEWEDRRWRNLAAKRLGDEWLTEAERNEKAAVQSEAAEAASKAAEKQKRISDEIPEPDEPVGAGAGGKGKGAKRG